MGIYYVPRGLILQQKMTIYGHFAVVNSHGSLVYLYCFVITWWRNRSGGSSCNFKMNTSTSNKKMITKFWKDKFNENHKPLHWSGTPGIRQARGREIAKVWLMGIWKGTLPVTIRQRQSVPLLVMDLSELQQSEVGVEVPFVVLFVKKFKHGVKLVIIEGEHGVLIWE